MYLFCTSIAIDLWNEHFVPANNESYVALFLSATHFQWAEEDYRLGTWSGWTKSIRIVVQGMMCLNKMKCLRFFTGRQRNLMDLHDKYGVTPADKASNKQVFIYKQTLLQEV